MPSKTRSPASAPAVEPPRAVPSRRTSTDVHMAPKSPRSVSVAKRVPHTDGVLYEKQGLAPAPGQTYFQVCVDAKKGAVLWRDWPKPRFSQAVANVILQPGEIKVAFSDYHDSDIASYVINNFGIGIHEEVLKSISRTKRSVKASPQE